MTPVLEFWHFDPIRGWRRLPIRVTNQRKGWIFVAKHKEFKEL